MTAVMVPSQKKQSLPDITAARRGYVMPLVNYGTIVAFYRHCHVHEDSRQLGYVSKANKGDLQIRFLEGGAEYNVRHITDPFVQLQHPAAMAKGCWDFAPESPAMVVLQEKVESLETAVKLLQAQLADGKKTK